MTGPDGPLVARGAPCASRTAAPAGRRRCARRRTAGNSPSAARRVTRPSRSCRTWWAVLRRRVVAGTMNRWSVSGIRGGAWPGTSRPAQVPSVALQRSTPSDVVVHGRTAGDDGGRPRASRSGHEGDRCRCGRGREDELAAV